MADGFYRRLACARLECGTPFEPHFGTKYCSALCKSVASREQAKARGERRTSRLRAAGVQAPRAEYLQACAAAGHKVACEHCAAEFRPKLTGTNAKRGCRPRWCSMACRKAACAIRRQEAAPPKFTAYYAAHCRSCGAADGGKKEWYVCRGCKKVAAEEAKRRAYEAERSMREAAHKAAAKESACPDCGVRFCRLFGERLDSCLDCGDERAKEARRIARAARKALIRAVTVESVSPRKVFARDGYRCYLCACETPWLLRGTYEPNAPEVEHVIPIAKGGPHSYANTRCSCRACNADKGDDLLADYLARKSRVTAFDSLIPA